ncbi:MAG: hypothetical protein ACM34H_09035 [Deltaproteobacteria bacterium]
MDGKAETGYKRLPGRGPRRGGFVTVSFSRCSLYLGDDHLLGVDSNGFSEDYKRFYFSDIQAIVIRRTKRGGTWSIVLALMIACSLMGVLFLRPESGRILSWILSGTFLAFLLVNIFRGPTCVCHIITAVQEDQLPSLNRLRVARKVIEALRPAIEEVQGRLSPEEVSIDQSKGNLHPTGTLRQSNARGRKIHHDGGAIHMMAFAFILLDGILTGILLLYHTATMTGVSSVLTLTYCILVIVALVKQHESDIPDTVKRVTWASLGFVCVSYLLTYVLMVTTLMNNRPEKMVTQWDTYRVMLDLSPQDSALAMGVYAFAATCSLVLGSVGLVRVKKHRDDSASASRPGQNSGGEVKG